MPVVLSCGLPPEVEGAHREHSEALGSPALIRDLPRSNPFAFTRLPDAGVIFFASTPTEGLELYRW